MAENLLDVVKAHGDAPSQYELRRLVFYYPSYDWEHRKTLLAGYFGERTTRQLVEDKLIALGIDIATCSGRSLGGHARWARIKMVKAEVRIQYLRCRLDEGLTQRKAHHKLLPTYGSNKAKSDAGQSALRKITHCPKLGD